MTRLKLNKLQGLVSPVLLLLQLGHFFPVEGSGCNSWGKEKLKYPQFGGKFADHPSWKYDWSQLVHLRMDELTNLLKQREVVPKDAKMVLKNLNTLEEAWEFLDGEFSDQDRLTAERVGYLHTFRCSADGYC